MQIKSIVKDKLLGEVYTTRSEMGKAAAQKGAQYIKAAIERKGHANVIFAAAPSQNETLESLIKEEGIDWTKVKAFHMDEYIGLDKDAKQLFSNFLKEKIFSKLNFMEVHYIKNYGTEPEETCKAYSEVLRKNPVDVVFCGIGENAHIAFNDPHIADFNDEKLVKVVDLDMKCRVQQVNDKCFDSLEQVPELAVTLTVPALMAAECVICTVPASTKAQAVYDTFNAPISEKCPSTAMRMHNNATMYLDKDSAVKLL